MLLAEDLLLLLLHDASGKAMVDTARLDLALAGGVLLELTTLGKVDVTGSRDAVKPGRLIVRDGASTGDAVLDEALRRVSAMGPKKPQSALPTLKKGLREELLGRLVGRGLVRFEEGKFLGLFTTRSWPAVDTGHERRLHEGIHGVLVVGRTPTPTEAALIALIEAVDQVPKVVGEVGVPSRELRRRAKAVAAGGFASEAVRKAVEAITAATAAAIAAAAAASAGAGG